MEPEAVAGPGPALGGGGGPDPEGPEAAPAGTSERWLPYILLDIGRCFQRAAVVEVVQAEEFGQGIKHPLQGESTVCRRRERALLVNPA